MLRFYITLIASALGLSAAAQSTPGEFLDINNHHVRIHSTGAIGHDAWVNRQEVPAGSDKSTLNAFHIWTMTENQQIAGLSAERYRPDGSTWAAGGYYEKIYGELNDFQRVWKINRSEIEDHIASYTDPNYIMPNAIEMWPADQYEYGFIPFEDLDNDSLYEPMDGEYPLIKGDQAILSIYSNRNESWIFPGISGALPFPSITVAMMAYGYDCSNTEAIDNSFFVHYKLLHASGSPNWTNQLTVGLWADLDIGNPFDDYIASDVSRHMFYAYNGDNNDETTGEFQGYGQNPPAHGVVVLKGLNAAPNNVDDNPFRNGFGYNDGVIDNEEVGLTGFIAHSNDSSGPTGRPEVGKEYVELLRGNWMDSTTLAYGGDGYDPVGQPAKFMYPGNSDQSGLGVGGQNLPAWSESTASNVPGDRIGLGLMSSVAFDSGIVEFEIAHVFAEASGTTDAVINLKSQVDYLHDIYRNGGGDCNISFALGQEEVSSSKIESKLTLYPNPVSDVLYLDGVDSEAQIMVFNLAGVLVAQGAGIQLDVSALGAGVYIIRVDGENARFVKH